MGDTTPRLGWPLGVLGAILLAAYVGFRLPSQYTMTLYNVTLADGAWRRGLLGTIFSPVIALSGHRYGAMALLAFCALGLLLVALFVVALRARWSTQKVLVIAWLVSPAGGYLFHNVGYADQWTYVLLLACVVLLLRGHPAISSLVMATSVFLHEATLFTTLPIYAWLLLITWTSRRQAVWALPPLAAGVVAYFLPLMSEEQVSVTLRHLKETLPFEVRDDAVALFGRSLSQTWAMDFYKPWEGALQALPVLVMLLPVSIAIIWGATDLFRGARDRRWVIALGATATVAPLFLVFVGWDFDRWIFLSTANFLIVALIALQGWPREPHPAMLLVAILPTLLLHMMPMAYYDGYKPRTLSPEVIHRILYSPHTEFLGFPRDRL